MNDILNKSLRKNIDDFLKDNKSNNKEKEIMFDDELSIKLLEYCIANNEMFAVHY